MSDSSSDSPKRLLDPVDRVSEVIFGLIMALTFTCAMSAADAKREDVHTMMLAALGCNVAWGLVDAVMYLMANFVERGRGLLTLRAIRSAESQDKALVIIRDALPPVVGSALSDDELESIRRHTQELREVPSRPSLGRNEWLGAVAVFLWVFASTFPVVIPFIFIHELKTAVRVSNLVALILLMISGYALGLYAQHRPWRMAVAMTLLGTTLIGITIALGG